MAARDDHHSYMHSTHTHTHILSSPVLRFAALSQSNLLHLEISLTLPDKGTVSGKGRRVSHEKGSGASGTPSHCHTPRYGPEQLLNPEHKTNMQKVFLLNFRRPPKQESQDNARSKQVTWICTSCAAATTTWQIWTMETHTRHWICAWQILGLLQQSKHNVKKFGIRYKCLFAKSSGSSKI